MLYFSDILMTGNRCLAFLLENPVLVGVAIWTNLKSLVSLLIYLTRSS